MKRFAPWIVFIVVLFTVQSGSAFPPRPDLYKGPINDLIPLDVDTPLRVSRADIVFDLSSYNSVTATYEIENVTNEDCSIDFAMPYARHTMQNQDYEATVLQDGKYVSYEFCSGGFKEGEGYSDSAMQKIRAKWNQRGTRVSNEIGTLTSFKIHPSRIAVNKREQYTVHAWIDNPKTKLFTSGSCSLSNEQLGHLEIGICMDEVPEFDIFMFGEPTRLFYKEKGEFKHGSFICDVETEQMDLRTYVQTRVLNREEFRFLHSKNSAVDLLMKSIINQGYCDVPSLELACRAKDLFSRIYTITVPARAKSIVTVNYIAYALRDPPNGANASYIYNYELTPPLKRLAADGSVNLTIKTTERLRECNIPFLRSEDGIYTATLNADSPAILTFTLKYQRDILYDLLNLLSYYYREIITILVVALCILTIVILVRLKRKKKKRN